MTIVLIFWKDTKNMTTVGFIGSGQIGSTIARLAIAAGHQVVLSNSRGPETLADTAAELGPRRPRRRAGRPRRPVTSSWSRCRSRPSPTCPPRHWRARRSSTRATTAPSVTATSPSSTASRSPRASCCCGTSRTPSRESVNNIFYKHLLSLARPTGAADRSYLPIAGDSAPAKAAVTEFIESIGYSVVDAGPLADSWRQATGTPVWGTPYGPYSNEKGQPAGEGAIRAALATATR